MSEGNWLLEKDLCRCCHAKGKFKNLAEPCLDSGEEEIYSDMLKYCFDIELLPIPGLICAVTYTICEICITSLRDATKFKRNVAACEAKLKTIATCEDKFKELFSNNVVQVENQNLNKLVVKVKVEKSDSSHEDDFSIGDDNDFDNPDFDYGEEKESILEKAVKKKTRKCQMKSKKIKSESKKKNAKSKKMKQEPEDDTDERKHKSPKFHLSNEDYTMDGTTFACKKCDKIYEKLCSLRFHIKTVHYKIRKSFLCPYCEEEFVTLAPFTVHKLEIHNIDDRFKCNACKGAFNTKTQLRKHINNFHMLGEKHSCEFCDYESFSFESMYKHKFKHKTSKDHHCKYCTKSFLRKTTKDLHERIHTGDRRKVCSVCGQAFVQKASLNYHMTKYHPGVHY